MEASSVPGEERHPSFTRPEYFSDRPVALRVVLVVVVPTIFGLICGYFLGHSKTVYIALQIVAAIGGYIAGWEHRSRGEAAIRGLAGGAFFGTGILVMHELLDRKPLVDLPHPAIILLVFTAGIGAILAAVGASARAAREENPPKPFKLDFSLWMRGEYYGFAGAAVLFLSLFLPWYGTSANPNAQINGARGTFNAFQTFKLLDILLVAACTAPFILAWIVARGHALTWRPGEVTMIVGMTAFVLIFLNGIILGKPGGPDSEIELKIGWFIGLLGSAGICAAGVLRQAEQARDRKPPGVL